MTARAARRRWPRWLAATLLTAAVGSPTPARAQGDGPRVFTLAPTGLNVFSTTFMDLSTNFNFQQDILIEGASVDSHVWALSYLRFFSVGGRFAEVWLTPIAGDVAGTVAPGSSVAGQLPSRLPRVSGWADPYVAMRVGLVGAPALSLPAFATHRPGFQLYALLGASVPVGDYEASRPVNLGTNRWAVRLGLPMVKPFGDPGRPVTLEVMPSVYLYTDNDEPFRARIRRQDPLFVLESHVSHNITSRIWASADARYQAGGETTTDDVADGNPSNHLGAGVSVGLQLLRPLSVMASYGRVVAEADGARGNMVRLRVNLAF